MMTCATKKLSNAAGWGMWGLEFVILEQLRKTLPLRGGKNEKVEVRSEDGRPEFWGTASKTEEEQGWWQRKAQRVWCLASQVKKTFQDGRSERNYVKSFRIIKEGKSETDLAMWGPGQHWHEAFQWNNGWKSLSRFKENECERRIWEQWAQSTIWEVLRKRGHGV